MSNCGFGFNGNVNNFISGLTYMGAWNANTNVPFLQSGVGVAGEYYIVSVAGTTNLDGTFDWQVGDWAIFEGATNMWQKIDNHDIVSYNTVQNEGVSLPQRQVLDFQGLGVDAQDVGGKTVVTVLNGLPATNYGLYAQTSNSTPVTGTIVEQSLIGAGVGTLSVPANGFFLGASFRADLGGVLNTANNQTVRIRVKTASGVLFLDSGVQSLSNLSNTVWTLTVNFTIRQIGVATLASIVSLGRFSYAKTVNGTVEGFNFNTVNSSTFDTTIPNTLVVTAQFGSANLGNSIYSDIFVLNKIY